MMKALVKTSGGYDQMFYGDVAEPVVSGDLVKIKVMYCGICGTDLHTFEGKYFASEPPLILGHEFSGIVVEVGPDVKKIKVGDRVTSETTYSTCGTCEFCLKKDYNLCAKRRGLGTQKDGGFAQYVVNREESLHILPENVSLLQAALTEPMACVVHGMLERMTIEEKDTVVVFGPGAIGLFACMIALAKKATVILAGTSRDAKRFEIGKKLGVHRIVNQQEEDINEVIKGMTDGMGANKIIECSGAIPALNKGFEVAKKNAEILQLGLFTKDVNEVNLGYIFPKELTYLGSRTQKPSSWRLTLQLMSEKLFDPTDVVTLVDDLENWREGFEKSAKCEEVKVVLRCNPEADNYF